jgi:hypothetical protein
MQMAVKQEKRKIFTRSSEPFQGWKPEDAQAYLTEACNKSHGTESKRDTNLIVTDTSMASTPSQALR